MRWPALMFCVAMAGCSSSDNNENNHSHDDHENHMHGNNDMLTVEDHACDHTEYGPEAALTAGATVDDAPSFEHGHTRYDIALQDGAGFIVFDSAEESRASFFFNADVDLAVSDGSGLAIEVAEEFATVDTCDLVVEGFAYDLSVGAYTLEFSGAPSEVSMVYVPPIEEEHEHEHEE